MQYTLMFAVPMITSALGRTETPDAFVGVIRDPQYYDMYISVRVSYGKFSIAVVKQDGKRVRDSSFCIVDDVLIKGATVFQHYCPLLASLLPEPYLCRVLRRNTESIAGDLAVLRISMETCTIQEEKLAPERRGGFIWFIANYGQTLPPILVYRVNANQPIYTVTPRLTKRGKAKSKHKILVSSWCWKRFATELSLLNTSHVGFILVPEATPGLLRSERHERLADLTVVTNQ